MSNKKQKLSNQGDHFKVGFIFGFIAMIATLWVGRPKLFGVLCLVGWFCVTVLFEFWQMLKSHKNNKSLGGFWYFVWHCYLPHKWLDTVLDIVCGNIAPLLMIIGAISTRRLF